MLAVVAANWSMANIEIVMSIPIHLDLPPGTISRPPTSDIHRCRCCSTALLRAWSFLFAAQGLGYTDHGDAFYLDQQFGSAQDRLNAGTANQGYIFPRCELP